LEIVAFSCGHAFRKTEFYTEILPEFYSKMSVLDIPIPITTKMMMHEYQQRIISLACPVCVHRQVYDFQSKHHGKHRDGSQASMGAHAGAPVTLRTFGGGGGAGHKL